MSPQRGAPRKRYTAVVLAAGEGRRFGGPKALALVEGTTALERVVRSARGAGATDILVVTGYHREAVAAVLRRLGAREARNRDPSRGMMSSVRVGVAAAPAGGDLLVWPVDHPFVRTETVRSLVGTPADRAVVPTWRGRGGHPVLLPGSWRDRVLSLDDEGGLDRLLHAREADVFRLVVEDPGVVWDVDRPEDLERKPT